MSVDYRATAKKYRGAIAPTYRAHVAHRRATAKASARVRRDTGHRVKVQRVFDTSFQVYALRKVWKEQGREGRRDLGLRPRRAMFLAITDFGMECFVELIKIDKEMKSPQGH